MIAGRTISIPLLALVLATVVLVVQARVVVGGKTWDDARYHTEVAPARFAAAEAMQQRALPVWWDGAGLGVPLLAEPSHGAAYPPAWIAGTPRTLDLLWMLHLFWAALGVALWSRRLGASELGALAGGVLVAASGVLASAAIRGALPGVAYLPWVALAAGHRRPVALGVLIGAIALAGQPAVIAQAIALAVIVQAHEHRRDGLVRFGLAIAAGLAIGAAQWIPALALDGTAGSPAEAMPIARVLEWIVPVHAAGDAYPSVFIGVAVIALAIAASPSRVMIGYVLALAILAFVPRAGAGVHVAALAVILAPYAGRGLDALLAGERRAVVVLAGGTAVAALALGAFGALGASSERTLFAGGLGIACLTGACVIAWRRRDAALDLVALALLALVIAPNVAAVPVTAPLVDRAIVSEAPAWARAAAPAGEAPSRVFRPVVMFEGMTPRLGAGGALPRESLDEAMATLAGDSAAKWGIATARTVDPARPASHDGVWLAAASAGGQLFERYGIALAILPSSIVENTKLVELGRRGTWSLVRYPASPPAALVYEWIHAPNDATALQRMFPAGASRGLDAGLVVLRGAGPDSQDEPSAPQPCTIERWALGAIDLSCEAHDAAYAVVSSTASPGWSVTVDDRDVQWTTADVLRRAVPITAGVHRIAWRYTPPGLHLGLVIACLGVVSLAMLATVSRRSRRGSGTRDRASRGTT